MIVRIVLLVLVVATIAWLADQLAASRAQEDLAALASRAKRPGAAQYARAERLAERAQRRSFDRRALLFLATLELKGGDRAGAQRVLIRAVRAEPENGEAWLLLAQAAHGRDPALERRALQRVRELAPPVRPAG